MNEKRKQVDKKHRCVQSMMMNANTQHHQRNQHTKHEAPHEVLKGEINPCLSKGKIEKKDKENSSCWILSFFFPLQVMLLLFFPTTAAAGLYALMMLGWLILLAVSAVEVVINVDFR